MLGVVDSDAGSIVDEWYANNTLQAQAGEMYHQMYQRYPFFEKRVVSSVSQNVEANAASDHLLEHFKPDENGYPETPKTEITFEPKTRTALLPYGYIISPHQPPPLDTRLLDYIEAQDVKYRYGVDMAMNMSEQNVKADSSSGLHSRSKAGVDEAKSKSSANVAQIIADISSGIQEIHTMMHKDQLVPVSVSIPTRSLVSHELVFQLLDKGLISHATAAEESSAISSIHTSRMQMVEPKRVKTDD